MQAGTVKFFNAAKGFGFIIPQNGGKDLFVHQSELQDHSLNEGDQVQFEVGEGKKGPCAVKVKKV